jgi:YgiT-type zinc finger domain-containing protein
MTEDLKLLTQPCNRCQAGQKRLRLVTFITWIGQEIITVPDFPAWVCDICGHRSYDSRALAQLSLVLNPQAGQPVNHTYPQPPTNPPQSPPPVVRS